VRQRKIGGLLFLSRHIANPVILEKIAIHLEQLGLFLPIICTPEELLGGVNDD